MVTNQLRSKCHVIHQRMTSECTRENGLYRDSALRGSTALTLKGKINGWHSRGRTIRNYWTDDVKEWTTVEHFGKLAKQSRQLIGKLKVSFREVQKTGTTEGLSTLAFYRKTQENLLSGTALIDEWRTVENSSMAQGGTSCG